MEILAHTPPSLAPALSNKPKRLSRAARRRAKNGHAQLAFGKFHRSNWLVIMKMANARRCRMLSKLARLPHVEQLEAQRECLMGQITEDYDVGRRAMWFVHTGATVDQLTKAITDSEELKSLSVSDFVAQVIALTPVAEQWVEIDTELQLLKAGTDMNVLAHTIAVDLWWRSLTPFERNAFSKEGFCSILELPQLRPVKRQHFAEGLLRCRVWLLQLKVIPPPFLEIRTPSIKPRYL